MSQSRDYLSSGNSTSLNGYGYVTGGGNTGMTLRYSLTERYNLDSNTWTNRANISNNIRGHCAGLSKTGFWAITTGYDPVGVTGTNVTERYNDAANTWTTLANYPISSLATAGSFNDGQRSCVLAGLDIAGLVSTDQSYEYLWDANLWTRVLNFPTAQQYVGVTSAGNAFSGHAGVPVNTHYKLIDNIKDAILGVALEVW